MNQEVRVSNQDLICKDHYTMDIFNSILKEQLSSVEFVQDYVQLHFDGNTLTCYTWPTVILNFKTYNITDNGYRDALCSIITKEVNHVNLIEKVSLRLIFDEQFEINIKLVRDESNKELFEFIYFTSVEGKWLVLE
jgi:Mn-containing catalase